MSESEGLVVLRVGICAIEAGSPNLRFYPALQSLLRLREGGMGFENIITFHRKSQGGKNSGDTIDDRIRA